MGFNVANPYQLTTMNENTKRSSPILMNAILKAKTDGQRQSACTLVISALEDRDAEINKLVAEKFEVIRKYNLLVNDLKNIKSREVISN